MSDATATCAPILLINPNSSAATTAMMCGLAQAAARRFAVRGVTATRSPRMIVTSAQLEAAAAEVVELGIAHAPDCAAIVVGAFGDPGLAALRARVAIPVAGLCEAAMRVAGRDGRRFAVATVTPELAGAIAARAEALGLGPRYAGLRCTSGDPAALAGDPERLVRALRAQVRLCIEEDGAEAVIIGGGPLGAAARALQAMFAVPVIAPIPCAVRQVVAALGG
jgi:Asp/Glu/hydantoin racemase